MKELEGTREKTKLHVTHIYNYVYTFRYGYYLYTYLRKESISLCSRNKFGYIDRSPFDNHHLASGSPLTIWLYMRKTNPPTETWGAPDLHALNNFVFYFINEVLRSSDIKTLHSVAATWH